METAAASFGPRARRTREKLKAAAAEAMADLGVGKVKVADVTERAGVAVGLFYRYFPDLPALLTEVASDWAAHANAAAEATPEHAHPFDMLRAETLALVRCVSAAPQIFQAVVQATGALPEVAPVWRAGHERWTRRRLKRIGDAFPGGRAAAEALVQGQANLLDGFLQEYFLRANADLRRLAPTEAHIAELIAIVMYRALFLAPPPADRVAFYADAAALGAPEATR